MQHARQLSCGQGLKQVHGSSLSALHVESRFILQSLTEDDRLYLLHTQTLPVTGVAPVSGNMSLHQIIKW